MTPSFALAYHVILLSVLPSSAFVLNHDTVKGEERTKSQHFGHGVHHSGPDRVGINADDTSLSSTNGITKIDSKEATTVLRNNGGASSGENKNKDDSLLNGGKPQAATSPFNPYTLSQSKSIINEIPILVITSHVPPITVMQEEYNIVNDKEGFMTSDLGIIRQSTDQKAKLHDLASVGHERFNFKENIAHLKKTMSDSSGMERTSSSFTDSHEKINRPVLYNSQIIFMTSGNIKSLQEKIKNNVLKSELQNRLQIKKEGVSTGEFKNQSVEQIANQTDYDTSDTGLDRQSESQHAKTEVSTEMRKHEELNENGSVQLRSENRFRDFNSRKDVSMLHNFAKNNIKNTETNSPVTNNSKLEKISQDDFDTLIDKNIFSPGKEIIFSVDLNNDFTMTGADSGSINSNFDDSVVFSKNPHVGRINEIKDNKKEKSMPFSNGLGIIQSKLANKLDLNSVPVHVKLSENAIAKTRVLTIDSTDGFQTKIVSAPENLNSPKTVIFIEKIQSIPNQWQARNVSSRNDGFLAQDTLAHKPATSSDKIFNERGGSTAGILENIIGGDVTRFRDQNIPRAGSRNFPATRNTLFTPRLSPRNMKNERAVTISSETNVRDGSSSQILRTFHSSDRPSAHRWSGHVPSSDREWRGGSDDTRLRFQRRTDFRTSAFGTEQRPGDLSSDSMFGGRFLRPSLSASSSFGSLGTGSMTGFPALQTVGSDVAFSSRGTFSPTAGFSRMFPVISSTRFAFPGGTRSSTALPTDFSSRFSDSGRTSTSLGFAPTIVTSRSLPERFPFSSGIALTSPETLFVPPAPPVGYPAVFPARITPDFTRLSFPFPP